MPISLIPLNDKSPYLDYVKFESSIKNFLGRYCDEATIYVFNRFPAEVSNEASIDLLILIALEDKKGNFCSYTNGNGERMYFNNAIIPVTIWNAFEDKDIYINGGRLMADDIEIQLDEADQSISFSLLSFLEKRIGLNRKGLFIRPVHLILNSRKKLVFERSIVDNELNPMLLIQIMHTYKNYFYKSCYDWVKEIGYAAFHQGAKEINAFASKFSEYGYLTSRKIESVLKKISTTSAFYETIGKVPLQISGKAGTGKSTHLLHLASRLIHEERNVTILTYNHLLTYQLAYEMHIVSRRLSDKKQTEGKSDHNYGRTLGLTLMSFIYRVSKKLGVLHIMSADRIKQLDTVLNSCINLFKIQLGNCLGQTLNDKSLWGVSWKLKLEKVQNFNWTAQQKFYAIEYLRFLRDDPRNYELQSDESFAAFYRKKISMIANLETKNIFLIDYLGCLKNTLTALRDTKVFYNDFYVEDRFDLLSDLFSMDKTGSAFEKEQEKITLERFQSRVKNIVKGHTLKNAVLMVDESQDCHSYEREILYEVFRPQNVVVTHGGKEQLIRFANVCDWGIFNSKEIPIKKHASGNKSYRIKANILSFCNFIAQRNNIELNLEPFSEEDKGMLILDFRQQPNIEMGNLFDEFLKRGNANGCTPKESLMVLDTNSAYNQTGNAKWLTEVVPMVNEDDVIETQSRTGYLDFPYLKTLEEFCPYWNANTPDKRDLNAPYPGEVAVLNYDSCRGLEAWCVMCMNLDSFYEVKFEADEAETYLLNESVLLTPEQRASRFATTWVLMAATRSIDLLYLHLPDSSNEITRLSREYANAHPQLVRVFK